MYVVMTVPSKMQAEEMKSLRSEREFKRWGKMKGK